MKILVNTDNFEILNSIIREAKQHGNTIQIAKMENQVFDHIESEKIDAFVITSNRSFTQKAVDLIKKINNYIPVIIIGVDKEYNIKNADIVMPFDRSKDQDTELYAQALLHNIYNYIDKFTILQKLTAKIADVITIDDIVYDPTRKMLSYQGKDVRKLSPKMAGIFELLAANLGNIVKKEIILEKVWNTDNYFVGRSLDVFITHIRNVLREYNIPLIITNVQNVGLILNKRT